MKRTVAVFAVCIILLAGWYLCSMAEANAYERVTGKRVSTLDAMFLDLRVQESAKP